MYSLKGKILNRHQEVQGFLNSKLSAVGISLLGVGSAIAHLYHIGLGLGIFAVGVVLTSFGVAKTSKEIKATV